ncbi:MAG TPA: hypothetical protein VEU98_11395 [Candidatus Eremiobacteraceae bacterium]|nr:hypothetical protein [Candidatus Eremiobacteraceae bacterium]
MKALRLISSGIVLAAFGIVALGQSGAQKSDAEKSFDAMKTLAGNWEGKVSVTEHPEMNNMGGHVSFRVTSMGNALVHEMSGEGRPDHPVTMFYLDSGRLLLTHYCDAGNRPRMAARPSGDGKTVEFDFIDLAGGTAYGHMHHAVFTIVDADHHTEDWTYMEPGDKPVHAHIELQRAKS